MSANFEYGSFFNDSMPEQNAFTFQANYFTNLIETGKWKFRQFVKPQLTLGLNRLAYESISLNEGFGIDGFNSPTLLGSNRFLVTFQTQFYAPWDFIGFRFGPYLVYSFGAVSNVANELTKQKIYSQIGFGFLIKNQNLVFNTFQISIAFYPIIPGAGSDVFKVNSLKTNDFSFKNFETGRPSTLNFQ